MGNENVGRGNAVIRICGDVDIVVPDQLHLMTTYVLREQEDWFEDEIKFLRRYLRKGMHVLDIGANCGLYALSMARAVGENGHIVAVEPSSSSAEFLRAGVSVNGFGNVDVVQSALSNRVGTAQLHLSENSELNALTVAGPISGSSEPVELKTLDVLVEEFRLDQLDFVKMDAEGEEQRIIEGGRAFLRNQSPLIMYEIKAGNALNLDLEADFFALGYDSYRLLPGLDMLVPAEVMTGVDPYQLNLFCCKRDCAEMLCREGILLADTSSRPCMPAANRGLEKLAQLPFAIAYRDKWLLAGRSSDSQFDECAAVLELYAAAHEKCLSSSERYAALRAAYQRMGILCEGTGTAYRLGTYARIAWEIGQRAQAVDTLARALNALNSAPRPDVSSEPFLPASPHFDNVAPAGRDHQWLTAAILDQLLSLASYSGYFAHPDNLGNLEFLRENGFQRPEMERRRQLFRIRAGLQPMPTPSTLLAVYRPDNLNPSFWGRHQAESP
jgi:protein O-GlcNAc transferase